MRLAPKKLDRSRSSRYTRKPPTKATNVTVCIAAICSDPPIESGDGRRWYVVCASDRMLTAGVGDADIEYQPLATPKIQTATNSIAVLWAGDAFVQGDVFRRMAPVIENRVATNPEWIRVRELAELYSEHYAAHFHERADQEVFLRYGFGYEKFRSQNRELAPATIAHALDDLRAFQDGYPGAWTLFAGLDPSGAHIYSATDGKIQCHDAMGFAAIGIGARHASSQFMLARHSAMQPLAETLQLTYFAKKRSEVAPGVGPLTDMSLVGPLLGSLQIFEQEKQIRELEGLYRDYLKNEERLLKKSRKGINEFAKNLRPPTEQKSGTITVTPGTGEAVWAGHVPTISVWPASPDGDPTSE
jgi:hypothetical protein